MVEWRGGVGGGAADTQNRCQRQPLRGTASVLSLPGRGPLHRAPPPLHSAPITFTLSTVRLSHRFTLVSFLSALFKQLTNDHSLD